MNINNINFLSELLNVINPSLKYLKKIVTVHMKQNEDQVRAFNLPSFLSRCPESSITSKENKTLSNVNKITEGLPL